MNRTKSQRFSMDLTVCVAGDQSVLSRGRFVMLYFPCWKITKAVTRESDVVGRNCTRTRSNRSQSIWVVFVKQNGSFIAEPNES